MGIPFDPITQIETLNTIRDRLHQAKVTRIVTINAEFVLTAQKNPEFKKVLQTADLRLADGIGPIWASHFLKEITNYKSCTEPAERILITNSITLYALSFTLFLRLCCSLLLLPFFPKHYYDPLPERVTGIDLFLPLIELLIQENQIIFLLGGAPGVSELVIKKLHQEAPLRWSLPRSEEGLSAFRFLTDAVSPNEAEVNQIVTLINASGATALFVAFQFPAQDIWIAKHLAKMPNIKVAMGVGGTFDFIAGTTHIAYKGFKARRAPKWLQKLNLEWFWRLITQPFRWKRIFSATFVLIWKVYQEGQRLLRVPHL